MCSDTCAQFANILGGVVIASEDDLCVVQRLRTIRPTILNRRSRSPLAIAALFSFESPDAQGRTLNLGETVILQEEINPFISALRKNDILVTSLHNHWLFDEPRLMYIHWESIDEPLDFAMKTLQALKVLKWS